MVLSDKLTGKPRASLLGRTLLYVVGFGLGALIIAASLGFGLGALAESALPGASRSGSSKARDTDPEAAPSGMQPEAAPRSPGGRRAGSKARPLRGKAPQPPEASDE